MKALSGAEECCLDPRVDNCTVLFVVGNGICTCTCTRHCECLGLLGERILLLRGDRVIAQLAALRKYSLAGIRLLLELRTADLLH